jgi:2-isopropylmalate synthase
MDVVVSSVKAYIAAINKMLSFKETPSSAEQIPISASNI